MVTPALGGIRIIFKRFARTALILVIAMSILSCASKRPSNLGISGGLLTACPSSPNCVSSDVTDKKHQIEAFMLASDQSEPWAAIRALVLQIPRTKIVKESTDYLHAECQSALLGFVDDLELHHRPNEQIIAVRSASRLGNSDFGVNRRRIELLRASLLRQGIIR